MPRLATEGPAAFPPQAQQARLTVVTVATVARLLATTIARREHLAGRSLCRRSLTSKSGVARPDTRRGKWVYIWPGTGSLKARSATRSSFWVDVLTGPHGSLDDG